MDYTNMKQRAVNRIQPEPSYEAEAGFNIRPSAQGLQTGVPVRSLLHSQEVTFKLLDELHDVITTLENRLYHVLSPDEARDAPVEETMKRPASSTSVAMAVQTNDTINRCIYRVRNIMERVEL